jgi:hypothetical protein
VGKNVWVRNAAIGIANKEEILCDDIIRKTGARLRPPQPTLTSLLPLAGVIGQILADALKLFATFPIIIIIGSTLLVRTLAVSHRRFRNLIKTHGRTPLDQCYISQPFNIIIKAVPSFLKWSLPLRFSNERLECVSSYLIHVRLISFCLVLSP